MVTFRQIVDLYDRYFYSCGKCQIKPIIINKLRKLVFKRKNITFDMYTVM